MNRLKLGINSAFEIAKYVITICCLNKKPVTNIKLQMILYRLQLFYLQKTGEKLFYDEITNQVAYDHSTEGTTLKMSLENTENI